MKNKIGVLWFLPKKKKSFFNSSMATSDLINILSEDGSSITKVKKKIFYDDEAIKILDFYIEQGFGEFNLKNII